MCVNRRMKLMMTATRSATHNNVGPRRSSYGPRPPRRIEAALQWYVYSAYTMIAIATIENIAALIFPTLSPKFNNPTASPPRTTVKCNHDKNVRSLAKETLGSTRTGRAMRLVAVLWSRGCVDIVKAERRYNLDEEYGTQKR